MLEATEHPRQLSHGLFIHAHAGAIGREREEPRRQRVVWCGAGASEAAYVGVIQVQVRHDDEGDVGAVVSHQVLHGSQRLT